MIDTHAHLDACPTDPPTTLVARATRPGSTRIITVGTGDRLAAAARSSSPSGTTEVFAVARHPSAPGRRRRERARRRARASCSRTRTAVAVGETGLDSTATTRRTTASATSSRRSWRWPPSSASRSSSTRAPPTRTRRGARRLRRRASSSTASRRRACSGRRSSAASTSRSRATSRIRTPTSCGRRRPRSPPTGSSPRRTARISRRSRVRGRPNEPANVVHTVAALAEARGEDADELERQIDANAAARFGLP